MNPGPLKRARRRQLRLSRRRLTATFGWELQSGLFRFDGVRFELFRSPFGDQLLSTNVSALFAPPTGGLWVGYRFGGFSFLKNGKLTNFRFRFHDGNCSGLRSGPAWDRLGCYEYPWRVAIRWLFMAAESG